LVEWMTTAPDAMQMLILGRVRGKMFHSAVAEAVEWVAGMTPAPENQHIEVVSPHPLQAERAEPPPASKRKRHE
jgi:hypothetical protein